MKIPNRSIRTTVLFGLLCAMSYIPLSLTLSRIVCWPTAQYLTLWLFLAMYGVLLTRWGDKGLSTIVFPLLILLFIVLLGGSNHNIIVLGLVILSWMRSGICFHQSLLKTIGSELLICLGGGALVAFFTPLPTMTMMALGVWVFFLVQSLYFVLFHRHDMPDGENAKADIFMSASRRADEILTNSEMS